VRRQVTMFFALLLLLSPLPLASGSPVGPVTEPVEWSIPEAAEKYLAIVGPFGRSRTALNRMAITRGTARTYCGGVVRLLDRANLGFSRGLWPTAIEGEVKRLLRASVLLRSRHRQCQTARTGAAALALLQRSGPSNQRLWDAMATEAGLIRLSLGLPPS
jgi:hypothetical protein